MVVSMKQGSCIGRHARKCFPRILRCPKVLVTLHRILNEKWLFISSYCTRVIADDLIVYLISFTAGENAFKQFDKKDDGKISVKEINNAFKFCGITLKGDWLDRYSDEIDQDGEYNIVQNRFLYEYNANKFAMERNIHHHNSASYCINPFTFEHTLGRTNLKIF